MYYVQQSHKEFKLKVLQFRGNQKLKIFFFWVNRSTIKVFMIKFQFFLTPGVKFLDVSGAEEMRDGPMVSLAKMMITRSNSPKIELVSLCRFDRL